MILFTLLVLFTTIIVSSVMFLLKRNKFWKEKNIKHVKPLIFFGNSWGTLINKKNSTEIIEDEYNTFPNEDMIGHFEFIRPFLVIRNPEYIEAVLIKDFSHFTDRGQPMGDQTQIKTPLAANLFGLCGNVWRALRYKLSPLFTTGKLKSMFEPLSDCGENLTAVINSKEGEDIDMNEISGQFSMDVIGSCAYGIEPRNLKNPNNTFRTMGKKMFEINFSRLIRFIMISINPWLANKLRIAFIEDKIMNYFCDIVSNTMKIRKERGIERNDFIQLLEQLKEKGSINVPCHDSADDYLVMDKSEEKTEEFQELKITDTIILGSAFTFIFAGFHATASTLTYTIYELALNPEVMDKARKEVQEKIMMHGALSYEAIKNMAYLEKVVKESMRLHAPAGLIGRICTKEYTFPNGYVIKPGESIFISATGLHKDQKYWQNPLVFDPDRFDVPPIPGTYLPFGEGPRICIAMRFALLEVKFALAKLLCTYDIKLSEKTKVPVKMTPRAFLNVPQGEVLFKFTKLVN